MKEFLFCMPVGKQCMAMVSAVRILAQHAEAIAILLLCRITFVCDGGVLIIAPEDKDHLEYIGV
jgi:hypothetical protein